MAGLKVNFSEQEAASEGRSFDALPSGEYYCRITDVEDRVCGPESKNPGKPYWNVELTIQEGPYEDRKLWTNAMLFEGALYSLSQMLKATGREAALQSGEIPDGDEFVTNEVVVVVKKQLDDYAMKRDDDGEKQWKNEVKGFKAYGGKTAGAAKGKSGKASILP